MELIFYGAVFLGCALILYVSGEWVVHGLMRLSRVLHVREFVVAFFVMAGAASLPNLFVGITSAMADVIPTKRFGRDAAPAITKNATTNSRTWRTRESRISPCTTHSPDT